jgi:hypothetical protein
MEMKYMAYNFIKNAITQQSRENSESGQNRARE